MSSDHQVGSEKFRQAVPTCQLGEINSTQRDHDLPAAFSGVVRAERPGDFEPDVLVGCARFEHVQEQLDEHSPLSGRLYVVVAAEPPARAGMGLPSSVPVLRGAALEGARDALPRVVGAGAMRTPRICRGDSRS